jgi:hypothetical protein
MSAVAIVLVGAKWFLSLADPPQEWPDGCQSGRRSLADRGPWAVVGDAVEAEVGSITEDETRDTRTGRGSLHGHGCPMQRRTCAPSGHCLLPPHTPMDDSEITLPPWCA